MFSHIFVRNQTYTPPVWERIFYNMSLLYRERTHFEQTDRHEVIAICTKPIY